MIDVDQLRKVETLILDTAIDAAAWPRVIEGLRLATGAFGINITPGSVHQSSVLSSPSIDRGLEYYFSEGWSERDYRVKALPLLRNQKVFIDSDFMTEEDYQDEFFRFLQKWNIKFGAVIGFKAGDELLCASLHRTVSQDPFTDADKQALLGVSDRLSMAASMTKALSDAKLDGLSAGFDMMHLPLMLFDRTGRLIRMNAAAQRLLGPDLTVVRGEVRTRLPAESARLRHLIQETCAGTAQSGNVARVTREGRRPLIFRFQLLAGATLDLFSTARVMGLITDLQDKPASDTDALRAIFDLSGAEAHVALLLAQGESLRSISELRGISYETTRSHMKAIFQKTEVKRQSELVSLFNAIR